MLWIKVGCLWATKGYSLGKICRPEYLEWGFSENGGWWFEAYCGRTWMAGWKFGSFWSFKSDDTWIFGKTRRNCAHNSVTSRNFSQNKFQLCSLTISVAGWQKLAFKFLILWKPQTSQPEVIASSYFWPPWKASHFFFSLCLALSTIPSKSSGIFKREEDTFPFICKHALRQGTSLFGVQKWETVKHRINRNELFSDIFFCKFYRKVNCCWFVT